MLYVTNISLYWLNVYFVTIVLKILSYIKLSYI